MTSDVAITDPFEVFTRDQLRRRTSVKWSVDEDALPLFIAEMDVQLAEPVQRAVHEAIGSGDSGYACSHHQLADAYAAFAKTQWGADVDVSGARANGGVLPAIVELLRVLTEPGATVIVTPPVYAPFYSFIKYSGRVTADAPLGTEGRFDFEAIEGAFTAAGPGSAMVIANPHNPTGIAHTRVELEQLAQLAALHGVTVISDEIHSPLVYDRPHVPYTTVDPRGFAVFSASKAFNLAGLPASLSIAGPDASAALASVDTALDKTLGLVAATAHLAALQHGGEWLASTMTALDVRRRRVAELVDQRLPGVGMRMPEATYLAWLDFSDTALADPAAVAHPGSMGSDLGVAGDLAKRCGVVLSSGEAFGEGGQNRARFNFGTRFDIIEEAVDRIAAEL